MLQDEASFDGYFGEMAWDYAVPYESDARNTMAATHKVSGIPTLVIADREGNVITTEGVTGVMDDEAAESFPWKPKVSPRPAPAPPRPAPALRPP